MSPELAAVLALLAAGGSGCTILGFWLKFSDRTSKAEAKADQAEKDAAAAQKLADEAHSRITRLVTEFGDYRERVAREFVDKIELRELKNELVGAIDKLGDKLDDWLKPRVP